MKIKIAALLFFLFSGTIGMAQTFQEIRASRVLVNNVLRPVLDTIALNSRDSGALAYKNGQIFTWNGSKWNSAMTLQLTTTGTSGPATLIGNVLNIPQYTGGGASPGGTNGNVQFNNGSGFGGSNNLNFNTGTNELFTQYIKLGSTPINDNALVQILARDATTGEIKYRNASSLGGGGGGSQDLQAVLDIGNFTDTTIIFDKFITPPTVEGTGSGRLVWQMKPYTRDAGQVNFNWNQSAFKQGTSVNNIMNFGWNLNPGGGADIGGLPGIGESWESNYNPEGSRLVEKHEFYINPAGTQKRISSYTINTTNDNVDFYHTVSRLYLKPPGADLQYFLVQPGDSAAALQIGMNDTRYAKFTWDGKVGAANGMFFDMGGTPNKRLNFGIDRVDLPGLYSTAGLTEITSGTLAPAALGYQLGFGGRPWKYVFADNLGNEGETIDTIMSKRAYFGDYFSNNTNRDAAVKIHKSNSAQGYAMYSEVSSADLYNIAAFAASDNGPWYDNVLSVGNYSTVAPSYSYYGGMNQGGKSIFITQGPQSSGILMGTYDSDSVYFMTNNVVRLSLTPTGELRFHGTPANDNAATQVLVRDGTSGVVKYRDASTMGPEILSGSATLDFPSTSASSQSDLTITVTGATAGDVVSLGVPSGSVIANGFYQAYVTSTNTVTVRFFNLSGASSDPASGTFKVKIIK